MQDIGYAHPKVVEAEAAKYLAEFEHSFYGGPLDILVVPLEDMIENHSKLAFEVLPRADVLAQAGAADTGQHDVLGFYDVLARRIVVNEDYDPQENAFAHTGRFRFTLAHELGHYVLHTEYFREQARQLDFFADAAPPKPLCRDGNKSSNLEQQANRFASALLMPEKLLRQQHATHWDDASDYVLISKLAQKFQVSEQAMRIRLQGLNLLEKQPMAQLAL